MNNITSTEAGAPFDKLNADIILRSSDHVDFRLHKTILAVASPIFEGLFTLPTSVSMAIPGTHPVDDVRDGLQVVQITQQDSKTLRNLLGFFYPPPPDLESLNDLLEVMEAAAFYLDYRDHLRDDVERVPRASTVHETKRRLLEGGLSCPYCYRDAASSVRASGMAANVIGKLNRIVATTVRDCDV